MLVLTRKVLGLNFIYHTNKKSYIFQVLHK